MRSTRTTITAGIAVIASALLGAVALQAPASAEAADAPPRCRPNSELILNGSFENPQIHDDAGWALLNANWTSWRTTDASNRVEVWNARDMGLRAVRGRQIAEINATGSNVNMYQDIETMPGTVLRYEYAHRARDVQANAVDRDTTAIVFSRTPRGGGGAQSGWITDAGRATDNGWRTVSGTYRVPPGQWSTRVALRALDGDNQNGMGNLIDLVSVRGVSCR